MAADMSQRLGWIEPEILHRTTKLLKSANLPVAPPQVRHNYPSLPLIIDHGSIMDFRPTVSLRSSCYWGVNQLEVLQSACSSTQNTTVLSGHSREPSLNVMTLKRHDIVKMICVGMMRITQCPLADIPTVLQGMTPEQFMDIMAVDKKVLNGQLRLILLKGPLGSCVVTGEFDPAALQETLKSQCR